MRLSERFWRWVARRLAPHIATDLADALRAEASGTWDYGPENIKAWDYGSGQITVPHHPDITTVRQ